MGYTPRLGRNWRVWFEDMHPHGFGTEGPTKPQWPRLLARTRAYPLFRFNFAVTGSRAREAAGGRSGESGCDMRLVFRARA